MPETVSVDAEKALFVSGTDCHGWACAPLAQDASARCYDRLTGPDGATAILMDAGPDATRSIPPFLAIAAHLRGLGLCPPGVIAQSPKPRFLLIEDLGTTDIARWLRARPQDEATLYHTATAVLHRIAEALPPPGLIHLTPDVGAAMLEPFFDWFAATPDRPRIEGHLTDALARHAGPPDTLSLRDYHAENLIWRPERTGTDRVGLLDFQDAFVAPAAYDLVSLLRDARRDVGSGNRTAALTDFADHTGQAMADVQAACATLGVQRNLRILGIFSRLARRDGKRQYLTLIPRLVAHLHTDLDHPAMARLRPLIAPLLQQAAP